jgi:hypothetical protein
MKLALFVCVVSSCAAVSFAQTTIPVVISEGAAAVERIAAEELSRYLPGVYPGHQFPVLVSRRPGPRSIVLGTGDNTPALRHHVAMARLASPESYIVKRLPEGSVMVAGASPRAALYAAYAVLERLGYGFYLSYDAKPSTVRKEVDFAAWELTDAPVFPERIVFNWHNFLSSASTWEIEDWQHYISQAAKMRYGGIMVHAYGNNPMFTYQLNGKWKPVGYLATTRSGRDWGTQHVNDVRRLIGGEIFRSPVFGSSVAQVPEAQRGEAAMDLMKQVFAFARERALGITFALDVDTESANPQELIRTLPPSARIRSGKFELANPDDPDAFPFYRAQVAALVTAYPQITRLAMWFRTNGTPWRNLKVEEFPSGWKTEYAAAVAKAPELKDDPHAPGMFVMSKLLRVYALALRDVARKDIELAAGSWRLDFLGAADKFFPREVALMPLDWETVFDAEKGIAQLDRVQSGRKLLPVLWAHHDDHTYIGRPYRPYTELSTKLRARRSGGFGVIHWTTRPLDLYFKSTVEQVWRATENRSLAETCEDMAARTFGEASRKPGGAYLLEWVKEGRMFGRETTNRFIDVPLKDKAEVIEKCRRRLDVLKAIDAAGMTAEQRERLEYFRDYETFTAEFFRSHWRYEDAEGFVERRDWAGARIVMADCRPGDVVKLYAQAAKRGRISRGEEALIVSLNLRWLPFLLSMKQSLGMGPALFRFQPTQHEPLAQGAGTNTFWVDAEKRMWRAVGERETGLPAFAMEGGEDRIGTSGVRVEKPLKLRIQGMMGHRLAPGLYSIELTFLARESSAHVRVDGSAGRRAEDKFDIYETVGGELFKRQLNIEAGEQPIDLVIEPIRNVPMLAAVTVEPLRR